MNGRTIERKLTDLIAGLAPWLTPVPTAYLVGRATIAYLRWPLPIAIVAAVIIEALGLAAVNTALTLREYNVSKRKTDPAAPFALAAALVGVYLTVAILLTVALDIVPDLARFAPAVFPLLSLAGVTVLALRSDQRRRLEAIASDRAERQAERQAARQAKRQERTAQVSEKTSNNGNFDGLQDRLQAGRKAKVDARLDALLDACAADPDLTLADAARLLGVSRQTVYTYVGTLEAAGRLRKNGHGWEVLGGAK
jgi:hypothetical protein